MDKSLDRVIVLCLISVVGALFYINASAQVGFKGEPRPANPTVLRKTNAGTRASKLLVQLEDAIEKGNQARDRSEFAEAEKQYYRATFLSPRDARGHFGLGNVYRDQSRWPDAEKSYRRATELGPGKVDHWIGLNQALGRQSRFADLIPVSRRILSLSLGGSDKDRNNRMWSRLALGRALYELKRYDESLAAFREIVMEDDTEPLVWVGIGDIYYARKQFDSALAAYQRSFERNPLDRRAVRGLSFALFELKRYPEAIPKLELTLSMGGDSETDADASFKLGFAAVELKRYDAALRAYQRYVGLRSTDPIGHNNLGIVYYHLKRNPEAIDSYRRAIELQPRSGEYRYNLGLAYVASLNKPAALEQHRQLAPIDQTRANLLLAEINKLS